MLQSHYVTVASSLASITPESTYQPQAAEEILLAHLLYKCLAKNAVFMYRQKGQVPEFEPFVRILFHSRVYSDIYGLCRSMNFFKALFCN